MRKFGKLGLTSLFLLKKMIRDICTKGRAQHLTDLLVYFWSNKKIKNMTKKSDISRRKFKNIESPKMVSKQLKALYLRSYEQFYKKSDFKCFTFFVRFFLCHILSCSLRVPATLPLHNEGRRPELKV